MYKEDKLKRYVEKYNSNDEETVKQYIDNDHSYEFLAENIPYFECSDDLLEDTYYFRWWVFRKHIKKTEAGFIFTEFHPDVPWAGPYNSINCAAGHHISEARWLRKGKRFVEDYINFWFKGPGDALSYSSWLVDSIYEYAILCNQKDFIIRYLIDFIEFYEKQEKSNMTRYGLFWSDDDRDAMEMSISGRGLRPTLNSYMYANALAISKIAKLDHNKEVEETYEKKAVDLRIKMQELLWDSQEDFYKVIPQTNKEDEITNITFDKIPGKHNVKEEIGFIPWAFGVPTKEQEKAFIYLKDEKHFKDDYGPTTADKSHPDFGIPCSSHECLWNGPSWPFATTQTLNSMIRVLGERDEQVLCKKDFFNVLNTYTKAHYRIREDGSKVNWIDENLDPNTGVWLSREILKSWNWPQKTGGYERGKDYNHSAYCDLIIRGLCGLQIREDEKIIINPLFERGDIKYFWLDNIIYKNHKLTIAYDEDGSKYNKGYGLLVWLDNVFVAQGTESICIQIS